MNERFVEITTPSGRMETFVTHPEQDGPLPLVILYMDIHMGAPKWPPSSPNARRAPAKPGRSSKHSNSLLD